MLRGLCDEGDAAGDLLPDAVIGAVSVEDNCELDTLDRDFARASHAGNIRGNVQIV